ncbi:MAG: Cna B-type domain-containing protein, partial [Bacteroidales bacterium]|nr:Cna B-type domain-containing protein [Bacteroidales bacterium]
MKRFYAIVMMTLLLFSGFPLQKERIKLKLPKLAKQQIECSWLHRPTSRAKQERSTYGKSYAMNEAASKQQQSAEKKLRRKAAPSKPSVNFTLNDGQEKLLASNEAGTSEPEMAEAEVAYCPRARFEGETDELQVLVQADAGVFPYGTEMRVEPVASDYALAAVNSSGGAATDALAADITFWHEGEEVQPQGEVFVQLTAKREIAGDSHHSMTIDDEGNATLIASAASKASIFNTNHFTVYGIVGRTYNNGEVETKARYTYEFYAGTPGTDPSGWAKVDNQIVIFGEDVREPKLPAAGDGYYFNAWETEEGETLPFTNGVIQSPVPEGASEDRLVRVYARYDRVFYVFFHTKEKGSDYDAIHLTREGETGDEITVDDVELTSVEAPNAFVGWLNEDGDTVTGSVMIGEEDIHLYPDIRPGITVTFNANEGQFGLGDDAAETYEVVIPQGSSVSEPTGASLPTRTGYEFDGWYTDAECTEPYGFATSVEEDFTLYAKWSPDDMSYILRVYRENEDDAGYTIFSPGVRDGVKTGDPVPVSQIIEEFKGKNDLGDYKYFHLNGTDASGTEFADNLPAIQIYDGEETPGKLLAAYDSEGNLKEGDADNAIIAGDGSTIVRVNFSRDSFVLKFVFRYSDWVESENTSYYYVNGIEGTYSDNYGVREYGTKLSPGTQQAGSVANGGSMNLAGTDRIIKYEQSLYEAAYKENPTIQGFFSNHNWWFNAIFRPDEGQTRFDENNPLYRLTDPKNGNNVVAQDGDTLYCAIRWTNNPSGEVFEYKIRDVYYLSDTIAWSNENHELEKVSTLRYAKNQKFEYTIGQFSNGYRLAEVTNYDETMSTINSSGIKNKYAFKWNPTIGVGGGYEELVCHWVPNKYKITFVQEAQADLEIRGEDIADGSVMEYPYGTGDLNSLITEQYEELKSPTDTGDKWIAVTDTHGVTWTQNGYRVTYADDGTEVENLDAAKLDRDLKVTMLWAPEEYVVYYDPDDRISGTTRTEVKAYGRAKSWKNLKGDGEVPQKEGYIFTGWTAYEPAGEGDNVTAGVVLQRPFDFGTAITRNYYLKASWTSVSGYSVRYDAAMYETTDGTSTVKVQGTFTDRQYYDDPATYLDQVSVPVTAVQPEAEGYRFLGWRLPEGDIVRGGSFILEADKCDSDGRYVLTAVYGEETEGTTVTYHARYPGVYADNKAEIPHDVINGDFTVAEPDATGIEFRRVYVSNGSAYRFKTWTNDENAPVVGMADGFDYFDPMEIAAAGRENNHLYAVWEVIVGEVSYTVNKVWDDNNNNDGIRPATVTFEILNNGALLRTVELGSENQWRASFTLPKYDQYGDEIAYNLTVREIVPEGYTATVNGFTVTNTLTPEDPGPGPDPELDPINISVSKTWDDFDNILGTRPSMVTVTLLADGVATGYTHTLSADENWTYTFHNLPASRYGGYPIHYTVRESEVRYYTAEYSGNMHTGLHIKNTLISYGNDLVCGTPVDIDQLCPCMEAECPATVTADGNTYTAAKIDGYCWMTENLRTPAPNAMIYRSTLSNN